MVVASGVSASGFGVVVGVGVVIGDWVGTEAVGVGVVIGDRVGAEAVVGVVDTVFSGGGFSDASSGFGVGVVVGVGVILSDGVGAVMVVKAGATLASGFRVTMFSG